MATVTVLAAGRISRARVERRLARAGYELTTGADSVRVVPPGGGESVVITTTDLAAVPESAVQAAKPLLGFAPRSGITCGFDGPVGRSDAWPTVVDIARAVAATVPLAVLDDHHGDNYLVHPRRGLIPRAEYDAAPRTPSTSDLLRRILGGRS
jgi:hypothetical protein